MSHSECSVEIDNMMLKRIGDLRCVVFRMSHAWSDASFFDAMSL